MDEHYDRPYPSREQLQEPGQFFADPNQVAELLADRLRAATVENIRLQVIVEACRDQLRDAYLALHDRDDEVSFLSEQIAQAALDYANAQDQSPT